MAVLVAGIGYIGSKLVEDLLQQGERVAAVDNFFSTDRQVVQRLAAQGALDLVEGSVTSRKVIDKCLRRVKVDTIYWLAAQASAHPEAAPPRYTEVTNLLAPRLMLEAARECGVRTVILASSLKVYGPHLDGAVDESRSYGPFTDLAHLSHCYVEKLAEMYARLYGLRCLAVRLGVVYGLGPVVKRDYRFMTVPNKFCLQAVRGEELVVTPAGMRPTGFIHIADASAALRLAARHEAFGGFTPVNAATEVLSPLEVARIVQEEARAVGLEVRVSYPKLGSDDNRGINFSSRLETVGFKGSRFLRPTIRGMLEYFAAGQR